MVHHFWQLSLHRGSLTPKLLAYQATIIQAERNYEGKRWVTYDRQYKALALKDLNWFPAYIMRFHGTGTPPGHLEMLILPAGLPCSILPRNPHRPMWGWFPTWVQQLSPVSSPHTNGKQEICRRYNKGRYRKQACQYGRLPVGATLLSTPPQGCQLAHQAKDEQCTPPSRT